MYYDHPTYQALLTQVGVKPADDTARLVLCDWLEEYDGPDREAAWAHARLARDQIAGVRPAYVVWPYVGVPRLPPGVHEVLAQLAPWDKACCRLRVSRGFVDAVWVYPWRYTRDLVARLFARQPIARVHLTPREPVQVGPTPTHEAGYRWAEGYGDVNGEVHGFNELAGNREERDALRAAAARGENVLQPYYVETGDLIPGPLFRALCRDGVPVTYPTAAAARTALDRAADVVAHRWAGRRRSRPVSPVEVAYYCLPRNNWASGPWDDEPDALQWTDAATGYPCEVSRGPGGSWNGYVRVTDDHPLAGVGYDDLRLHDPGDAELTYSASGLYAPQAGLDVGEAASGWWFGFDNAHYTSRQPALEVTTRRMHDQAFDRSLGLFTSERYVTLADVRAQCVTLAEQLRAATTPNPE